MASGRGHRRQQRALAGNDPKAGKPALKPWKGCLRFWLPGCALALAATSAAENPNIPLLKREYQDRAAQVSAFDDWSLDGRLALSDGKEGGSGALNWIQHGNPAGFHSGERWAGVRGSCRSTPLARCLKWPMVRCTGTQSVTELVKKQIGWKVPVDALQWWVRGLAFPGDWQSRRFDDAGRLVRLEQSGWTVEFSQYQDEGPAWMPGKLNARRADYAVKVVVKKWQIGAGEVLT